MVRALVAANLVAFLLGPTGPAALPWAFVPRTLLADPAFGGLTILTSMFLHAGWMHLLGNVWFLWVFGPSVEEALGPRRFAALYAVAGVAAALAQAALDPLSRVPMIGASGAIGGVLAAYVSLHPLRRIETLAFVFLVPIPALFFVLEWFAINLLNGVASVSGGGVAWWAHIGGFLAGLALVRMLFPRAPSDGGRDDERAAPPRPLEVVVRSPSGERYSVRTFEPPTTYAERALAHEDE